MVADLNHIVFSGFPLGVGGLGRNPLRGEGMDIFWNYTIIALLQIPLRYTKTLEITEKVKYMQHIFSHVLNYVKDHLTHLQILKRNVSF